VKKTTSVLLSLAALSSWSAIAQDNDSPHDWNHNKIKHVLLISIDGLHAVDYKNCSAGIAGVNNGDPYCPNLAALSKTGVNYVSASTSKPSDSFPGLTSIVSGASPRTLGVYYDVAYDRYLAPPTITTGNGVAGGDCKVGVANGTTTEYEEGIDIDQSKLNGGGPGLSLTDGTVASIDPKKLPRDPAKGCGPVYPWDFVRTNTVFGVIHKAGGYTAWSDKHPAYSSVSGPGGGNLDDFYAPEINSAVIALPGVTTPEGLSCSSIPDPSQVGDWTGSFENIKCYDTLKVQAVLNWIDGKKHLGDKSAKVPAIFGMNFQAVSIGEKLIEKGVGSGGYLDAAATPSTPLVGEIKFVDDSIGEFVKKLKADGLYEETLVIVTAKHGQSPIDPHTFFPIPGHSGNNGITPATLLASYLPWSESPLNPNGIGSTEDDVSLIWLTDSSNTLAAVKILEENLAAAGIGQIFYGPSLALNYNEPGLPPWGDSRTPDIIVTPNVGVIYTGSTKKQEEHGGFAHDDTNVILLVENPHLASKTVSASVSTSQIAPTILEALDLDPTALEGVRLEGTGVLPSLGLPSK
jgi:hypothetical protein